MRVYSQRQLKLIDTAVIQTRGLRGGEKWVMKTWLRLETREEIEGRAAFLREGRTEGMKFWNSCLSCLPSKQENLKFRGFMGNKAELEVFSSAAPLAVGPCLPSPSSCVHTNQPVACSKPDPGERKALQSSGPFWHSALNPLDVRNPSAGVLSTGGSPALLLGLLQLQFSQALS